VNLRDFFSNPTVSVFLGTLPLLLTIAWGLITQNQRLSRLETKIDSMDMRLTGELSEVKERLARVETRLEGKHVILQS
jgi:hypothetical protein